MFVYVLKWKRHLHSVPAKSPTVFCLAHLGELLIMATDSMAPFFLPSHPECGCAEFLLLNLLPCRSATSADRSSLPDHPWHGCEATHIQLYFGPFNNVSFLPPPSPSTVRSLWLSLLIHFSPKGLHTRSLSPGTWDIWNIWTLGASLILLLSLRGLSGDSFPLSLMKLFCTHCYNSLRNTVGFMVSQMGQKRLWISLLHPIWTKWFPHRLLSTGFGLQEHIHHCCIHNVSTVHCSDVRLPVALASNDVSHIVMEHLRHARRCVPTGCCAKMIRNDSCSP